MIPPACSIDVIKRAVDRGGYVVGIEVESAGVPITHRLEPFIGRIGAAAASMETTRA